MTTAILVASAPGAGVGARVVVVGPGVGVDHDVSVTGPFVELTDQAQLIDPRREE